MSKRDEIQNTLADALIKEGVNVAQIWHHINAAIQALDAAGSGEGCIRCGRERAAEIHDGTGNHRGNTGTGAMHFFVGRSEKATLIEAKDFAWFAGKSRPKGGKPTPEMVIHNGGVKAAQQMIAQLYEPLTPAELTEHDHYWQVSADKLTFSFL